MAGLAELIESHKEQILDRWRSSGERMASAEGLSQPELLNLIPKYLTVLATASRMGAPLTDEQHRLIESHLSHRLRQGYELNEVVTEFACLGRVIAELIDELPPAERPAAREVAALFSQLHATTNITTKIFSEHLLEDEQREKRYARLMANIVAESVGGNGHSVPLAERLREVLQLIMQAMGAETASLLLADRDDPNKLIAVASAGISDEALSHYVTNIDSGSFASRVATTEREPVELSDVTYASVPLSESLRQSGVRSLLGVRLPAHHALRGVLYVGLTEPRSFTPSELRRLASLGDRLTLHLENAHLVAELRSKVSALRMFVDVLAHDLRGPLSAARLSVTMLAQDRELLDSQVPRLARSLDRAERMVTDLLDAHRVEAGEPLPLTMSEFDLAAVAREVADELEQQHPGRVVVQAPSELRGCWSRPYLRRAIWNLAVNGLKYGEAGGQVRILLLSGPTGIAVAVHNDGAPLSGEQQRRLFHMFARGETPAAKGALSWGLGLALVRGAAEAHGGSVDVQSDTGHGTTFTMKIPRRIGTSDDATVHVSM